MVCMVLVKEEEGFISLFSLIVASSEKKFLVVDPPYSLLPQVNDLLAAPPPGPTPGETLSKRCMVLVKTALKPEIWPSEYTHNRSACMPNFTIYTLD